MSDYTKLSKSPKSALLYYYITNGLEFILSVAVYVIFYFIWIRFEWPHYLLLYFVGFRCSEHNKIIY